VGDRRVAGGDEEMKNLWMRVEMDKEKDIVVVDCGYAENKDARDRADKIFSLGVSKKHLAWGPSTGGPRIHILIPQDKVDRVLKALPIENKKSWFGATHSYL
jgi:hypothetical protein